MKLRLALAACAVMLLARPSAAQSRDESEPVRCRLGRAADDTFTGSCTQGDSTVARATLRRPGSAMPHLWIGTLEGARFRSAASRGPEGRTGIGVDVRPAGALRLGREWLRLAAVVSDRVSFEFSFRFDRPAPGNEVDVEILRRTRAFLDDPARWNADDPTDMDSAPTKGFGCAPAPRQSMFCALYQATLTVSGDYAHFRPAVNAVRRAIADRGTQGYRHPLVDFNNAPGRTLSDVQAILDSALVSVRRDAGTGGA